MYCVYLTSYKGNKLPPFYIGHSELKNIENGYLGSVSSKEYKDIWLNEIRENRNLFKIQILSTFSDRIDAREAEERLQRKLNVLNNSLYINKSIGYKNFSVVTRSKEHQEKLNKSVSRALKGRAPKTATLPKSEEHKKKLSDYFRGRPNPKNSAHRKGKKLSEEHKRKISRLGRRHTEESKLKMRIARLATLEKKRNLNVGQ